MFGFFLYALFSVYSGWSPGEFDQVLLLLFVSCIGFICELYCVCQMVKPLHISFLKIGVFTLAMRFVAFCLSFFKIPLAGVLHLLFEELKLENSYIIFFIAVLISALILTFIKVVFAASYFKSLPRKRIIKWLLLSNIVGYFLPYYLIWFVFMQNWEAYLLP
jgi:hypothetical protein